MLIVDDEPMMRRGLAGLINQEADLVAGGEADSAAQALNLVAARRPDLVLADLSLPDKSGFQLIKDIQVFHPGVPVLVVSAHDESLYAERVLRAGARGYIMKREGDRKLMQAIRQVLAGRIYVSEKISARILELFSRHRAAVAESPLEGLTDREFEVFELIGQGRGTREIAEQLRLSVKTVAVHRARIKQKLKLRRGAELVSYAIRWTEIRKLA